MSKSVTVRFNDEELKILESKMKSLEKPDTKMNYTNYFKYLVFEIDNEDTRKKIREGDLFQKFHYVIVKEIEKTKKMLIEQGNLDYDQPLNYQEILDSYINVGYKSLALCIADYIKGVQR